MSNLDVIVGWVEASSVRETAASLLLCAMAAALIAWLVLGAVFLARHTTADLADWLRARTPAVRRERAEYERAAAAERDALARRRFEQRRDAHMARVRRATDFEVGCVIAVHELQLLGRAADAVLDEEGAKP
jgi:uncharacterized membrane protein YhiD involved in acid resistance